LLRDHSGHLVCIFSTYVGEMDCNFALLVANRKALEVSASKESFIGSFLAFGSNFANVINQLNNPVARPGF